MPSLAIRSDLSSTELRRLAEGERDARVSRRMLDPRRRSERGEPGGGGEVGGHGPPDAAGLGDPLQPSGRGGSWRPLGLGPPGSGEPGRARRGEGQDTGSLVCPSVRAGARPARTMRHQAA